MRLFSQSFKEFPNIFPVISQRNSRFLPVTNRKNFKFFCIILLTKFRINSMIFWRNLLFFPTIFWRNSQFSYDCLTKFAIVFMIGWQKFTLYFAQSFDIICDLLCSIVWQISCFFSIPFIKFSISAIFDKNCNFSPQSFDEIKNFLCLII